MKKITLIIALIFTTQLFSQYDLQFSRVITMVLNSQQEATVPEGKVWKVEAEFSGNPSYNYMLATVDSSEFGGSANVNATFGSPGIFNSPVWLKAGDRVRGTANLSIIEFNLVTAGSSGGGGSDSGTSGFGKYQIENLNGITIVVLNTESGVMKAYTRSGSSYWTEQTALNLTFDH